MQSSSLNLIIERWNNSINDIKVETVTLSPGTRVSKRFVKS